jgi:hypothetical protein
MLEIFLNSDKSSIQKNEKNKTALLIGCIVLLVFGVILLFGGLALVAYNMGTDADGYTQSSIYEVRTDANAFALWVGSSQFPSYLTWMSPKDIGQAMWTVKPVDPSTELFVGWAEAVDGKNYLDTGIRFSTPPVWRWTVEAYYAEIEIPPSYSYQQGAPSRPPAQETFWIETVQSTGKSKITWDAFWDSSENGEEDRKMLVIMNLAGSENIEADIQLGFNVPIFHWLPIVFIPIGVILCIISVFLIKQNKLIKRQANKSMASTTNS